MAKCEEGDGAEAIDGRCLTGGQQTIGDFLRKDWVARSGKDREVTLRSLKVLKSRTPTTVG